MRSTFRDTGQTLEDFVDMIYVQCPKCTKRADVIRIPSDEDEITSDVSRRYNSSNTKPFINSSLRFRRSFSPRKLSCLHCGYTKIWTGNGPRKGGPYDWYFRLPLWVQTPCGRNVLWAFNEEHLSFLEMYITAKQRAKFAEEGQIRNQTMVSRLPFWKKSAKNRQQVLKGIVRLKNILEKS
jgi:hypothetical protein